MKKILLMFLFSVLLLGCSRNNRIEQEDIFTFELEGESYIELELNEEYEEFGFIATSDITGEDLSSKVVVDNKLDTSVVGSYLISYKLSVGNNTEELFRTVIVLSYEENEVSLDLVGSKTLKVEYNSTFKDPFVVARDERLGKDISSLVEVTGVEDIDTSSEGAIYTISYELDYNGVFQSTFRTVEIEYDLGVSFDLNRDTTSFNSYYVGEEYVEYGAEIIDNISGDIIDDYKIKNNFIYDNDVIIKGNYIVEYSIEVRGHELVRNRLVSFEDKGITIDINESSTSKNSYNVGEEYIEYGITITDNTTGDFIDEYQVTDNFEYENSKIKEGTYTVEYKTSFRGVEYFGKRLVMFEDAGLDIDLHEPTKDSYNVGEVYIEYGVSFIDKVTGEKFDDYIVENNFIYEEGIIIEGSYRLEYSLIVRGKEYSIQRVISYIDLGLDITLNKDDSNDYYVTEDYNEYGIRFTDEVTGDVYDRYTIENNFIFNDSGNYIQEGSYEVYYYIEVRGKVYKGTRIVKFSHVIKELKIEYLGVDDTKESPHQWSVSIGDNLLGEDIIISFIAYYNFYTGEDSDEIKFVTIPNDLHNLETKSDKLIIKNFNYIWNGIKLEGVVL